METFQSQSRRGPRAIGPRAPSRPSSVAHGRMTAQGATSSVPRATAFSPSIQGHRQRQKLPVDPPGSPRPVSRAMTHPALQESPELVCQPAVSPFLQEKLQKERKAESEKLAYSASLSRTDMSASVDLGRLVLNSPFKVPEPVGCRPQSSTGHDPPKKKSLGVKEMEEVVSSLHKQNFDLKLELFHRRERQTTLEERIEALEAEKEKSQLLTDRLLGELEKRDRAVEEAVAMIVLLEAKVDHLVKERSTVHGLEAGLLCPGDFASADRNLSLTAPILEVAEPEEITKPLLNRMPSFLSERGENTENLRTVYLGARGGSALSLPPVPEASAEADASSGQGLASPTLSVLSESSFLSVYGQKGSGEDAHQPPPDNIDEPLALDGLDAIAREDTPPPRERASSVGRAMSIAKLPPRSSTTVPFQSITHVIGHDSPLQRLMRLDQLFAGSKDIAMPANTASPPRKLTKEEKRSALRKVLTDGPGGVLLHDQQQQGLPPTPDTISSSTLHRFKTSFETLAHEQELNGALFHPSAQDTKSCEAHAGASLRGPYHRHQRIGRHGGSRLKPMP